MPEQGKYYSVNEANRDAFPPAYKRLLMAAGWGTGTRYSSRYVGSMVADIHRTLLRRRHLPIPP